MGRARSGGEAARSVMVIAETGSELERDEATVRASNSRLRECSNDPGRTRIQSRDRSARGIGARRAIASMPKQRRALSRNCRHATRAHGSIPRERHALPPRTRAAHRQRARVRACGSGGPRRAPQWLRRDQWQPRRLGVARRDADHGVAAVPTARGRAGVGRRRRSASYMMMRRSTSARACKSRRVRVAFVRRSRAATSSSMPTATTDRSTRSPRTSSSSCSIRITTTGTRRCSRSIRRACAAISSTAIRDGIRSGTARRRSMRTGGPRRCASRIRSSASRAIRCRRGGCRSGATRTG